MVNEINRPPRNMLENDALRVRMENSNRNIERMQQEHRELLQEMELLRHNAAELATNNSANEPTITLTNTNNNSTDGNSATEVTTNNTVDVGSVDNIRDASAADTKQNETLTHDDEINADETSEDNSEYLREKIAQIAAMKAQFKRVQHLVDSANTIDAHLAGNQLDQTSAITTKLTKATDITQATTATTTTTETPKATTLQSVLRMQQTDNADASNNNNNNNAAPENVELLMGLLSMFDDFKNDLRDQATTLRAERDRLRELKAELLRRRNHQSS